MFAYLCSFACMSVLVSMTVCMTVFACLPNEGRKIPVGAVEAEKESQSKH